MTKLTYFGKITEAGGLDITNKRGFLSDLKELAGKAIRITIEGKAKRSNKQNAYLHGCIVPIVKAHLLDLGWKEAKSDEWVKNYIKYNCLIKEVSNEQTGEVIKTLGESSMLTKSEFMDFVADIQRFCSEMLDLYVPDPGEQVQMEF